MFFKKKATKQDVVHLALEVVSICDVLTGLENAFKYEREVFEVLIRRIESRLEVVETKLKELEK